ncbi:MAG: SIMPL domain-containing protein [Saprospiraceae bacterium]|nr:SIMPL domain-containing protein [Saprospiraceae bacterium]
MKKHLFTLILFALNYVSLVAQTLEKETVPHIDVSGSAEMLVVPDEIYLLIRLQERKQGRNIPQQENEMKNRLSNAGIDLSLLTVKNYLGDYRAYKLFKKDLMTVKEFSLKLNSAKQLDSVFKQLDLMDVEDVRIERLSHSKMPEFRREVKTKAIVAAKEKADYLLQAIGEQTGKPIHILENDYQLTPLEVNRGVI